MVFSFLDIIFTSGHQPGSGDSGGITSLSPAWIKIYDLNGFAEVEEDSDDLILFLKIHFESKLQICY